KDNNNKNLTQTNTSENDWLSYLNDFYKNHKMAIWIAGGITITLTLAVSAYYFRDEIQAFLFGNKCSAPREEILEDVNNSTALNTAPATDINVTEPEQSISTVEEVNPIIAETNINVPVLNLPDQ